MRYTVKSATGTTEYFGDCALKAIAEIANGHSESAYIIDMRNGSSYKNIERRIGEFSLRLDNCECNSCKLLRISGLLTGGVIFMTTCQ